MMEEGYHATTLNRFYPDMSNVNKNITVEAKLITPPMYILCSNLRSSACSCRWYTVNYCILKERRLFSEIVIGLF